MPQAPTPGSVSGSAFLWEPPGQNVSIYVEFDVVDRLGFDVMRGFGAVPRRGAEIGGILLGTAERGEKLVVRIEDYVQVPCEHLRGPSFILSEGDWAGFDEACARWAPASDRRICVVGYFRSNTREGNAVSAEDRQLLDARFPGPDAVFLLIKPYATRVSEAAFYLRQEGVFPEAKDPPMFPFRRKELGGGRPPRGGRGGPAAAELEPDLAAGPDEPYPESPLEAPLEEPESAVLQPPAPAPAAPSRSRFRGGWVWIPLSFIFLLLGVVLGFQIAISLRTSRLPDLTTPDPYSLDLSAVKFGDSVHLKWNVEAQPLRSARGATLTIHDGENVKTTELDERQLSAGSLLYRHVSAQVRFRLEVKRTDRTSVAETLDVHVTPPQDAASNPVK